MTPAEECEQRELLESYKPWLRFTARMMLKGRPGEDDLVQEGLIGVWRGSARNQDQAWLRTCARNRMKDLIKHWVVSDEGRSVPAGNPATDWNEGGDSAWRKLTVDNATSEMVYHRGEIHAALGRLTSRERDYVVLRFWFGYRKPDMADHFGHPINNGFQTARKKLAHDLAHLNPWFEAAA